MIRIATYNVEWFSNLFDDEGHLLNDNQWSGRRDVRRGEQLEALGTVFNALKADAVMIIEAPDSHSRRDGVRALENFAGVMGLKARRAIQGFVNDTQQEIALLYDPDRLTVRHDPQGHPRFDSDYRIDSLMSTRHLIEFVGPSRHWNLPYTTAFGTAIRMIGVHAKSKAPHGAERKDEVMRIAIANRRKQLAQCIWLRERVEEHLDAGDPLIVSGGFQ